MKGMYVQHNGKWRKILDVKDSGKPAHLPDGGNFYTLEGVNKPVHQSKIGEDVRMPNEIEKYDRVEVTPDGKRELDYGVEPLDKEPLGKRWKKLKKALDSDAAILSIRNMEYVPEQDNQNNDQSDNQSDAPSEEEESQDTDDHGNQENEQDGDDSDSEQLIEQALKDEGYDDTEIAHILHGHILPEATIDDHKAKNEQVEGQINQQNMVEDSKLEREHNKKMQELEYQKAASEIADPEVEKNHRKQILELERETQKKKVAKEDLELSYRQKLHELEVAAKQKEMDKEDPTEYIKVQQAAMELKHRERMLNLEYSKAKKEAERIDPAEEMQQKQLAFDMQMKRLEAELQLKFKEKELALKLKITEEAAKQKAEHAAVQAEEDAKVNAVLKREQSKHKIAEAKKLPAKEDKSDERSTFK